ncbi:hypothetical protein NG798_00575 [Ancylothrix sp. C2]|uniref:hypothetical protein n=1 Tax=Ancylothrix sp. D3o TaxID=2953691 RepID=UPI0021BB93C6|nr:hypothetical protein [Ancylothrix sp. D3o]MCT7948287.1 hypothetical protein [Ancylothrix sp. D3o]
MAIFQTRNTAFNSTQWFPDATTTTSVSVTNIAAGVELVPAVATPTAPRHVTITNEGTSAIFLLVGTGSGATPTNPSATNSTFSLDPGMQWSEWITGDRIVAGTAAGTGQAVKVGIAPGIRL